MNKGALARVGYYLRKAKQYMDKPRNPHRYNRLMRYKLAMNAQLMQERTKGGAYIG